MKLEIEISKLECFVYGLALGSIGSFAGLQQWDNALVIGILAGLFAFRDTIWKKARR